ncbi:RHS repeat-associated core domain-containing protein [Winslowiella iniecta]|uniref:RHS repeat-associated core domain-containing protein n=1 Tax=Winslowiella iniecta TaxID=1560201 RepID=A0A0L7TDW5_9GAMM|nr:RHS repeat-associated core domain-containing protein [Winslowiella iniecta]KOC89756.1 hypothetical protein NG42_11500 [Winslowiella iniecta]KOC93555.1 hypothetical protein NG43_09870 [Winslowiella iniecta]
MNNSVLAFNGERSDAVSHAFHSGNGYRAYPPALMRFHCPDSWSPFAAGGINPYAWCAGDPINRSDPSGHMSWLNWVGFGVGVGVGIFGALFSGGTSLAIGAALATTAISSALGLIGQLEQPHHPKLAQALGWASLAVGIVGAVGMLAAARIGANAASSLAGRGAGLAEDTIDMDLDSEFRYRATLGRSSPRGAAGGANSLMSVIFEDTYQDASHQAQQRLNIWAFTNGNRISLGDRMIAPRQLATLLNEHGIVLDEYHELRFISCNSTHFAREFTYQTLWPTSGFRGVVTLQGEAVRAFREYSSRELSIPAFNQLGDIFPERTMAAGVNIFDHNAPFFRIVAGNPVSFRVRPGEPLIIDRFDG